MGAAKENRDIRAASEYFGSIRKEKENTNMFKAIWWRDLMIEGRILTFRACCGRIITVGPYQVACGYHPGFSLLGLPAGKEYHDSAWGIALRIIEHCGRVKPILIDGEKTK